VANRLAPRHREIGWDHIYSATLALIEAGESDPRDRRVLAEARERFRRLREAAIFQFRRSGNTAAVAEMQVEIERVCGKAKATTKEGQDEASAHAGTRAGEPRPDDSEPDQASDSGWTDGRGGDDFRVSPGVRDDERG